MNLLNIYKFKGEYNNILKRFINTINISVTETHKTSSSRRLSYLVKGYLTRILSLQTQYGERATIYELVCPALSPMSRASPCDDHIVTIRFRYIIRFIKTNNK